MEDSTKDYLNTNVKSLKSQISSKNVPTADKNDIAADLKQTQMTLRRRGTRTEFNEDAPVNATGPAVAGLDKNPPVSVAAQSNYAKKNQKESPVLAMIARTPLKTFREFLEK